jgi:hypothetical protein
MTAAKHTEFVDQLRREFKAIGQKQSKSSDWWAEKQKQLRELVDGGSDPSAFFGWPPIRSTMFFCGNNYAQTEIEHLWSLPDWENRWHPALMERGEFDLPRLPFSRENTAITVHHAYHLSMFEEKTGVRISDMSFIFEFGGGYGDTCRIVHRLGFKGNYVICDLPELLALQRFFLGASGIQLAPGAVEFVSDIVEIAARKPASERACAISTWAIEESVPDLMRVFVSMMPQFDHFLFAFSSDTCFSQIEEKLADVEWHKWEIPFLKGNRYMMGKRHAH